jgi:hypothetical protein
MSEQNSLEGQIQSSLQSICEEEADGWTNATWTRKIESVLASLGKARGFGVWAKGVDVPIDGGEWLYDLVWLRYRDGFLVDVPLVMESEWEAWDQVKDDFEKLLLARAGLRLLIFQDGNEAAASNLFGRLESEVRQFKHTVPGDQYMFACWMKATRRFIYQSFIA